MKKQGVKTLVTHNGSFHADDLFAAATLSLALGGKYKLKIIRTRDEKIISRGDVVFDVGAKYSPAKNLFDHHQKGGAGQRKNGIPYAAFGLVWKKFGKKICGSQKVSESVDKLLVQPIDALDNGVEISKPIFNEVFDYGVGDFLVSFNPTWKENEKDVDRIFLETVSVAKAILVRLIIVQKHLADGEKFFIQYYKKASNKRIIILDRYYPYKDVISNYKQPLFIVHPDDTGKGWVVRTVRVSGYKFKNRKDLPKIWAGKRDGHLQKVTGVSDAVFCHNKRFLAVARSRAGAIKLAQLALRS